MKGDDEQPGHGFRNANHSGHRVLPFAVKAKTNTVHDAKNGSERNRQGERAAGPVVWLLCAHLTARLNLLQDWQLAQHSCRMAQPAWYTFFPMTWSSSGCTQATSLTAQSRLRSRSLPGEWSE